MVLRSVVRLAAKSGVVTPGGGSAVSLCKSMYRRVSRCIASCSNASHRARWSGSGVWEMLPAGSYRATTRVRTASA